MYAYVCTRCRERARGDAREFQAPELSPDLFLHVEITAMHRTSSPRQVILFFHANAEDLGMSFAVLRHIRDQFKARRGTSSWGGVSLSRTISPLPAKISTGGWAGRRKRSKTGDADRERPGSRERSRRADSLSLALRACGIRTNHIT